MFKTLFRRKALAVMVRETELAERQLKRTLGPVSLSALGIGAIIGAGIFSTAGTAAAGGAGHWGAGPALVLSFLMVAVGIIRLRQTHPDWPRPFRVPGYPWVPLGAVLTSGYLMVELPRITWIRSSFAGSITTCFTFWRFHV